MLINFNSGLIYFNQEISCSHAIRVFDIRCNNFSKTAETWSEEEEWLHKELHLTRNICVKRLIWGAVPELDWRVSVPRSKTGTSGTWIRNNTHPNCSLFGNSGFRAYEPFPFQKQLYKNALLPQILVDMKLRSLALSLNDMDTLSEEFKAVFAL
jgi:hypothetical protein